MKSRIERLRRWAGERRYRSVLAGIACGAVTFLVVVLFMHLAYGFYDRQPVTYEYEQGNWSCYFARPVQSECRPGTWVLPKASIGACAQFFRQARQECGSLYEYWAVGPTLPPDDIWGEDRKVEVVAGPGQVDSEIGLIDRSPEDQKYGL